MDRARQEVQFIRRLASHLKAVLGQLPVSEDVARAVLQARQDVLRPVSGGTNAQRRYGVGKRRNALKKASRPILPSDVTNRESVEKGLTEQQLKLVLGRLHPDHCVEPGPRPSSSRSRSASPSAAAAASASPSAPAPAPAPAPAAACASPGEDPDRIVFGKLGDVASSEPPPPPLVLAWNTRMQFNSMNFSSEFARALLHKDVADALQAYQEGFAGRGRSVDVFCIFEGGLFAEGKCEENWWLAREYHVVYCPPSKGTGGHGVYCFIRKAYLEDNNIEAEAVVVDRSFIQLELRCKGWIPAHFVPTHLPCRSARDDAHLLALARIGGGVSREVQVEGTPCFLFGDLNMDTTTEETMKKNIVSLFVCCFRRGGESWRGGGGGGRGRGRERERERERERDFFFFLRQKNGGKKIENNCARSLARRPPPPRSLSSLPSSPYCALP